ncbi:MAG: hypothetical protein H0T56_01885 [Pseudaminobacter sp.]|nr:hypothetical protein [Pseudaminobacter sp.]
MVNIRATLERALSEFVLDEATAAAIVAAAKAKFYQERTWASALATARQSAGATLDPFTAWLPKGKVDQKRHDALLLLDAVQAFITQGGKAEAPTFSFEWTETWAHAPWRNAPLNSTDGYAEEEEAILDELRLDGTYARVRREALFRMLASDETAKTHTDPDRREIARETMAFRSPRGLLRQSDVHRWAAENGFDVARFERMVAGRASIEKLAVLRDAALRPLMLDQLRENDAYAALRDRARAKATLRATSGGDKAGPRIPRPTLLSWYFGARLGTVMPDDIAGYAAAIGLEDIERFYDLLATEYQLAVASAESKDSGRHRKKPLA